MAEELRRKLDEILKRLSELQREVRALEREVRVTRVRPMAVAPMTPPGTTTRRCYVCGDTFTGPDDDTIWYLRRIMPQPAEYWMTCPDCVEPRWGYPKHRILLENSLEAGLIAPYYKPWIQELIDMLPDP